MSYADKTLTCRECGASFVFTAGEQEFYASRGYENAPSRCPACRAARRDRPQRSDFDAGPRQMYPAVCASCGVQTEVPFRPRNDRPVYCSDCFRKMRAAR